MVEEARSWFRENQTLVLFLLAQAIAIGAAAAAVIAYSVKLENARLDHGDRAARNTPSRAWARSTSG